MPTINLPEYGNIFATADSFDELRTIDATHIRDGYWALVSGAIESADGLGGIFHWNPASTSSDDNETIIRPNVSSGAGRWEKIAVGQVGAQGPQGVQGDQGAQGAPGPYGSEADKLAAEAAAASAVAAQGGAISARDTTIATRDEAAVLRDEAGQARDATLAALTAGSIFTDTTIAAAITAALASVAEGETFYATSDDVDYVGLYKDLSGVATEITRLAKPSLLDDALANAAASAASAESSAAGKVVEPVVERPASVMSLYSGSGLSGNSNGSQWTFGVGSTGYVEILLSKLGLTAGAYAEFRFKTLSGNGSNVQVRAYNGTTDLNNPLPATLEGETYALRGTVNASADRIRIYGGTISGTALTITRPVYTRTAATNAIIPKGVPQLQQIRRLANAVADSAPNLFVSGFTAVKDSGAGTSPTKNADNSVTVPVNQTTRLTNRIAGIDPTKAIAVFLRVSGQVYECRIEARFPGGSPGTASHALFDYGDGLWGRVLPANTYSATPNDFRFLIDNRNSGNLLFTAAEVTAYVPTVKNATTLPGDIFDTWPVRKVSNRVTENSGDLVEARSRNQTAMGAAFRAKIMTDPVRVAEAVSLQVDWQMTAAAWVDGDAGDDTTGAGTRVAPWATFAKAIAETSAGEVIMLRAGQSYDPAFAGGSTAIDRTIIGWGSGTARAVLDSRQNLAGLTWTNISGDVWEALVTHRDPLGNGRTTSLAQRATGSNLFNFGLFGTDGVEIAFLPGDDSVAARTAAIQASSDSNTPAWFVYPDGGTNVDPRFGTGLDAQTAFRYRVALGPGINPNGLALRAVDRQKVIDFAAGGHCANLDFIGGGRKDHMSLPGDLTGALVRTFHNCRWLQFAEHGFVGVMHGRGLSYFQGRAQPLTTYGAKGQTSGYALNFHASSTVIPITLSLDWVEVHGASRAISGHGQSNGSVVAGGYDGIAVGLLVCDNVSTPFAFDNVGGTTTNNSPNAYIPVANVGRVELSRVDGAMGGGVRTFVMGREGGGFINFRVTSSSDNHTLVALSSEGADYHLENAEWTFGQSDVARSDLVSRGSTILAVPNVTFSGVRDLTPASKRGGVNHESSATRNVAVTITGRSRMLDIMTPGQTAAYPSGGLIIEADSQAGLASLTRAEIVSALTALDIPVSIDAAARIVDGSGIVLSDLTTVLS